jgi:hypothetical protein
LTIAATANPTPKVRSPTAGSLVGAGMASRATSEAQARLSNAPIRRRAMGEPPLPLDPGQGGRRVAFSS